MRTFPANFAKYQGRLATRPYLILEVAWGGATGTRYYLDRPIADFTASGTRGPTENVANELVTQWGQLTLSLKEHEIGSYDTMSVAIADPDRTLRGILNSEAKQRKAVRIYRMWDEDDCQWPADAALLFVGGLRPFDWDSTDSVVTLEIEDASKRLLKSVECLATRDVFPFIPEEYQDRNLPLAWGQAHRVEAILVESPWETRTRTSLPKSAELPVVLQIDDHPEDMNVETMGNDSAPIECWLGQDLVEGYLLQSNNPNTVASTFTVTGFNEVVDASATIRYAFETGEDRYAVVAGTSIQPASYRGDLTALVSNGTTCLVLQAGQWEFATVATITADTPWLGAYRITFVELEITDALKAGQGIKFLNVSSTERVWPAGVVLRPKEGDWIYVANALPSKGIVKVEGYGEMEDDAGEKAEGFIILGGLIQDSLDGTVVIEDESTSPYEVDLVNDRWKYIPTDPEYNTPADLMRDVTTITFEQAPRSINPSLRDNRIWVTLNGVDDAGTSFGNLISLPPLVILWYLESIHLMALDSVDVDFDSFLAAATTLAGRFVGFAQTESVDGLTYLQDLARQCRSLLFFDQGKVSIKVLSNSPGTSVGRFHHDNILAGSLRFAETSVDDIVTRLTANWRYSWDDKHRPRKVPGINYGAEDEFGRVGREFEVWMYHRRSGVAAEVAFWLSRWSRIYREIEFLTFSDGLHLQPADWITLDWLEGVFFRADDLVVDATSNTVVRSEAYAFDVSNVGQRLLVTSDAGGWTPGVYTINSVDAGDATLSASPGALGSAGGAFVLGEAPVFNARLCEVLQVSDDPMEHVVRVKCRCVQFTF